VRVARRRIASLAILVAVSAACSGSDAASPSSTSGASTTSIGDTTSTVPAEIGTIEIGPEARRAMLVAPDEVTGLAPLVVLLHGYTASSTRQDAYLGVTEQSASRGLYVLLPEGTTSPAGRQFWDATPACCNFTGTPVDDVAYLSDLIDEAIATRPIDPARIYLFGHSNGGFMAHRMACERADQITAIASLAGSEFIDEATCAPTQPVSVLLVHGDDDELITYDGGVTVAPFPGAVEVSERWAARNGCDDEPVAGEPIDLDERLDGAETQVQSYEGCPEGIDVQLDTIEGGRHSPPLDKDQVGVHVLDWLLSNAR
jgi:polyhydroxybutyrate depolymerase